MEEQETILGVWNKLQCTTTLCEQGVGEILKAGKIITWAGWRWSAEKDRDSELPSVPPCGCYFTS